jgi:1-acyl-sn-glycerol-3-phosphate acyltransferase
LVDLVLGVNVFLTGDAIRADECSLIVMNHRSKLDTNFLSSAIFHASVPSGAMNMKLVIREELKEMPVIGAF